MEKNDFKNQTINQRYSMTKADVIFKENIKRIMDEGVFFRKRTSCLPKWWTSKFKYVTGAFAEYDLSGEFPITTLRPIQQKCYSRNF